MDAVYYNIAQAEAHAEAGEFAHAYFHLCAAYNRMADNVGFDPAAMERLTEAHYVIRSLKRSEDNSAVN